ncbi:hypothetical protein ACUSIJ_25145, partial [Pseudochelatococcus sp. B33]
MPIPNQPTIIVVEEPKVQVIKVQVPGMRGKQGPPGPPGSGSIDLPLAIDNPQDGDVLSYDTAQAAWKNRPRRNV